MRKEPNMYSVEIKTKSKTVSDESKILIVNGFYEHFAATRTLLNDLSCILKSVNKNVPDKESDEFKRWFKPSETSNSRNEICVFPDTIKWPIDSNGQLHALEDYKVFFKTENNSIEMSLEKNREGKFFSC